MKSKEGKVHPEQTVPPDSASRRLTIENPPAANPQNGLPVAPLAAFILIGKTGVGKSHFAKLLGGRTKDGQEPIVGEGIDSCTQKATAYSTMVSGREVLLVDTPGFDDSGVENLDILYDIISILYLFALRKDEIQTHGVIFLHDISEVRFSGSQRKTLSILRALCGSGCMGNVIIGTTKWSPEKSTKFEKEKEREQRFINEHWNGVYKTIQMIEENDRNVAVQIITDLLAKPPVLLNAQKEMLIPPHSIENTTVAKLLIPEAHLEEDQRHKEFLRELAEQEQRFEEEKTKNAAKTSKLEKELEKQKKASGENSEKDKEIEQLRRALAELAEQKKRIEEEKAKRDSEYERRERERGFLDDLFEKLKKVPDLTFAEKFGLAIAAPIILAPAALVAAPVGIIAAFVGLSNHFTGRRQ